MSVDSCMWPRHLLARHCRHMLWHLAIHLGVCGKSQDTTIDEHCLSTGGRRDVCTQHSPGLLSGVCSVPVGLCNLAPTMQAQTAQSSAHGPHRGRQCDVECKADQVQFKRNLRESPCMSCAVHRPLQGSEFAAKRCRAFAAVPRLGAALQLYNDNFGARVGA